MQQFLLAAILIIVSGCKHPSPTGQTIPVVGLDKEGKSDLNYIPKATFHNKMAPLIYGITDRVTTKLETHETSENVPWTLSRVTVGLGLEAEFEIVDEVLEAEIESDIELRFQKI
jgi:hypothetical protein